MPLPKGPALGRCVPPAAASFSNSRLPATPSPTPIPSADASMLFLNGELTPTLDAPPARNRPGVPGASVCEDEDACAESVPAAEVLDEESVDDCESWERG